MVNIQKITFLLLYLMGHCVLIGQPTMLWETIIGTQQTEELLDAHPISDELYLMVVNTKGGVSAIKKSSKIREKDTWLVTMNKQGQMVKELVLNLEKEERLINCIPTVDGGYVIVGNSRVDDSFDLINWVKKLDEKGHIQWSKTFPHLSRLNNIKLRIAPDQTYRVAVSSYDYKQIESTQRISIFAISDEGEIIWEKKFHNEEAGIVMAFDLNQKGGAYIAFNHIVNAASPEKKNVNLFLIDETGNLQWRKRIAERDLASVASIYEMPDKSVLLAGHAQNSDNNSIDFWLTEIAANQEIKGEYFFGTNEKEFCSGLTVNSYGQIIMNGASWSVKNGDTSIRSLRQKNGAWMICLDASKKVLWDYSLDNEESDYFRKILLDDNDKFTVITTTTTKKIGFGQIDLKLASFQLPK